MAIASQTNLLSLNASIEEILASIENIYHELGDISTKTKTLNGLSQDMVASVDVFRVS